MPLFRCTDEKWWPSSLVNNSAVNFRSLQQHATATSNSDSNRKKTPMMKMQYCEGVRVCFSLSFAAAFCHFSDNFVDSLLRLCRCLVKSNKKTVRTKKKKKNEKLFPLSPVASAIAHIYQFGEWLENGARNVHTVGMRWCNQQSTQTLFATLRMLSSSSIIGFVTRDGCGVELLMLNVDARCSVERIKALMLMLNDQKSATNENVIWIIFWQYAHLVNTEHGWQNEWWCRSACVCVWASVCLLSHRAWCAGAGAGTRRHTTVQMI